MLRSVNLFTLQIHLFRRQERRNRCEAMKRKISITFYTIFIVFLLTGCDFFRSSSPDEVITGESLTLEFIGAAGGRLELDVRDLTVNLTGAGNLELYGSADTTDVNIHGAGTLDALDLYTRTALISFANAGTVRISCSGELTVNAVGAGLVEYRGSPTVDISQGSTVSVRQVD